MDGSTGYGFFFFVDEVTFKQGAANSAFFLDMVDDLNRRFIQVYVRSQEGEERRRGGEKREKRGEGEGRKEGRDSMASTHTSS